MKRFADAGVLAAVADRAVGDDAGHERRPRADRSACCTVQNRAQPFLKVDAAARRDDGVGGRRRPAAPSRCIGADGTRVPLLRPGFRPTGSVSRCRSSTSTPGRRSQKKGDIEMTLPKMDMPVGIVEWELFVPERYSARAIGGNVIDIHRFPITSGGGGYRAGQRLPPLPLSAPAKLLSSAGVMPGQIRGRVVDASGAVMPGATVEVRVGRLHCLGGVGTGRRVHASPACRMATVTMTASLGGLRDAADGLLVRWQPAPARARPGSRDAAGNRHGDRPSAPTVQASTRRQQ